MVFLIENLVKSKKAVVRLLIIIYVCIELSAIFSILNYFQISQTIPWVRAIGLSGDPNELATYNVTAICIGYYLITSAHSLIKRSIYLLFILLSLVSLILSGSRGGALTLVIVITYILLMDLKINLRPIMIGVILISILAGPLIQIVPENLISRFLEIPRSIVYGDKTVSYRLELWRSSLDVWLDHPVFGVGSGMVTAYKAQNRMYLDVDKSYVTHNTYINILAEMGIVGFLIFMAIVWLTLKSYYVCTKQSKNADASLYRISLLLTSILVCWLTSSLSLNLQQNKFLWMSFGLALVIRKAVSKSSSVLQLRKQISHSLSTTTLRLQD
jgi:O-antigen ligase